MAKPDTRERAQWTLKGAPADPELRQLVAKAAQRQGQQLSDFVADTLRARALAVLKDEPAEGAAVPVKVGLPDLVEMVREMKADQERMMATLQVQAAPVDQEVRAEIAALKRSRWWRR